MIICRHNFDLCVFDAAVHHGVGTSSKFLQETTVVVEPMFPADGRRPDPELLRVVVTLQNDCSFPVVFM